MTLSAAHAARSGGAPHTPGAAAAQGPTLAPTEGPAVRYERITANPGQMGGMPCIRGLRIPVATVVAMVADGMSPAEIVAELPDLEEPDVAEALHYAAEALRERELPTLTVA